MLRGIVPFLTIVATVLALPAGSHFDKGRYTEYDDNTQLLAPRAHRVVRHHHHHHRHHARHGRGGGAGLKIEASPGPKPYCVDRTDINGKASDSGMWHNDWGWKCIDYQRKQHCTGTQFDSNEGGSIGELKENAKWTGGAAHDYPEAHCCVCGGGIHPANSTETDASDDDGDDDEPDSSDAPAASDAPIADTLGSKAKCADEDGWKNSFGLTCDDYKSKGYCNGIGFAKGMEWTGGKDYNFPEKACCHCQA